MTKKQRALEAVERLKARYPEAICSLNYTSAWQLLVATRLSAQCTDARVNLVTPALFSRYPTMQEMAVADVDEVGKLIYSCGFYKTKSKDLVEMSRILCEQFGGVIPDTVEELIKLPGVGRKTANLVVGDVYGKPAIVTDTHCIRITNRLGLVDSDVPVKVEAQLRAILPPAESNDFCHRLVLFGRDICSARAPKCAECPLFDICKNKAK
ncbi:MAG: endonuclease III [Clostridia bacterium]|nr:endonuclease III [Clostridia bacterium]